LAALNAITSVQDDAPFNPEHGWEAIVRTSTRSPEDHSTWKPTEINPSVKALFVHKSKFEVTQPYQYSLILGFTNLKSNKIII
jgi:hypothetical protein